MPVLAGDDTLEELAVRFRSSRPSLPPASIRGVPERDLVSGLLPLYPMAALSVWLWLGLLRNRSCWYG